MLHPEKFPGWLQLKSQPSKNIWIVGGGELLHSFIQENLVDELIVTVAPTIIGKGISLFKEGDYQLDLSLKGTRNFNQFVELHYEVKR
ncbi:dihydrofolate reductase family protein [Heyndrickxia sporothermodurans]|nr:dihydrofolate reductase family protein [Heyndrickxia sporothermodurans]MED3656019.1 dihydrofolate reductase family protein [Heyndrickxia sporothermodurans]